MTQQIATTPEQGKRLIACGVDPSTADMCYLYWDESGEQLSREEYLEIFNESFLDGRIELVPKDFGDYNHSYSDDSPAWSLGRLLALLPPTITIDEDEYSEPTDYDLFINPSMTGKMWEVSYSHNEIGEYSDILYETAQPCIIESVVHMVEALVSHKHKLNEIKQ